MATQIAATPVVRGKRAKELYEIYNKKPSKDTERGIKVLEQTYGKLIKNDSIR